MAKAKLSNVNGQHAEAMAISEPQRAAEAVRAVRAGKANGKAHKPPQQATEAVSAGKAGKGTAKLANKPQRASTSLNEPLPEPINVGSGIRATFEGNQLVLRIAVDREAINAASFSSTGKSKLVGNTHGWQKLIAPNGQSLSLQTVVSIKP